MKKISVLCIGDSLTAGFPFYNPISSLGDPRTSYPFHLRELLQNSFSDNSFQITTINAGSPGDTTQGVKRRLPRLLSSYQPMITIILGGTNDIALGYHINNIANMLEELWELIKSHNSQPVSCTLPPTIFPDLNTYICDLNSFILEKSAIKKIPNANLFLSLVLNGKLDPDFDSGDGVHLNMTGYQEIGKIIFKTLSSEILDFKNL